MNRKLRQLHKRARKRDRLRNRHTKIEQPAHEDLAKIKDRRSRVNFRVYFVYGMTAAACAGLIFRLSYLQITKGTEFRIEASQATAATMNVLPARGRIYDTNGNILAYDKPIYSIYYTQIPNTNTTPAQIAQLARTLSPKFGTTPQAIEAMIVDNQKNQNYQTIRLFKNTTNAQLAFVGEQKVSLPGISVQVDGQRTYPYGDLAGQVMGFVGSMTPQEQSKYLADQKSYQYNSIVGQAGLELQYEQYLQGTVGKAYVNQAGYEVPPNPGDNLQLALDGHLEEVASDALQTSIQSYEKLNHVQISDAALVMMDLKTGGVLAMVSYPYLDPNWFIDNSYAKHVNYLQTPGVQQNNVIENPHYPGSTVKPANLLTGLETGVITPNYQFNDSPGPLMIGTYPMKEDASYGWVNNAKAIAVSDDKFFYSLGLTIGKWFGSSSYNGGAPQGGFRNLQNWRNTSLIKGLMDLIDGETRFGLGQITGIDLPYEGTGTFYIDNQQGYQVPLDINAVKTSLAKTGEYPNDGSPVNLAFTAFGQGQQFTPIELLQYVAALATGGQRIQPHLLQRVYPGGLYQTLQQEAATAKPTVTVQKKVLSTVKLNQKYLKIVQQGMYAACNAPYGTAYQSFWNAPYKAAGKTGTAEIVMGGSPINNSVFIGYAPFNNPQIAVAVMVPGAGFGAVTAVPIARQLMDAYFNEHHASFMPKQQWTDSSIPSAWFNSPAYTLPEKAK